MPAIQLIDYPGFVDDYETAIGRPVRALTWMKISHLCNYLNHYARCVVPWTSTGMDATGGSNLAKFILPTYGGSAGVGTADRQATVLVAARPSTSDFAAATDINISSESETSTLVINPSNLAADGNIYRDDGVVFVVGKVQIAGDARAEITIQAEDDIKLVGWAAWELPRAAGGTESLPSAGVSIGAASEADNIANILNPLDFGLDKIIDTDKSKIVDAMYEGRAHNRVVLWQGGSAGADTMLLGDTGAGNIAVPTGNISIAPTWNDNGSTTQNIRVAIWAKATAGKKWMIETSMGNSATDNSGNGDYRWLPDKNGLATTANTIGDSLRLWIETGSNTDEFYIRHISIWQE